MDPGLLSALVGLAGATAGYLFRELRNRARPFFSVETVSGGAQRFSDEVPVPTEILGQTRNSAILPALDPATTMRDLDRAWDRADDVVRFWPTLRDRIDAVLNAASDEDLKRAIPKLVEVRVFDDWIILLLMADLVRFDPPSSDARAWIPAIDGEQRKGCVWFHFPGDITSFGRELSDKSVRVLAEPFIECVKSAAAPQLKVGLQAMRDTMEKEHRVALAIVAPLRSLLDERLRWKVEFFFANLSKTPVIIDMSITLIVRDRGGLKVVEPCYLAIVKQQPDGRRTLDDAVSPVVVKSESDIRLAAITTEAQAGMTLGNALREAFDRGEASFQLRMNVRRVGLFKSQSITTPAHPFRSTADRK